MEDEKDWILGRTVQNIFEYHGRAVHWIMALIGRVCQSPGVKNCLPFDWLCSHQHTNIHVRGIQLAN